MWRLRGGAFDGKELGQADGTLTLSAGLVLSIDDDELLLERTAGAGSTGVRPAAGPTAGEWTWMVAGQGRVLCSGDSIAINDSTRMDELLTVWEVSKRPRLQAAPAAEPQPEPQRPQALSVAQPQLQEEELPQAPSAAQAQPQPEPQRPQAPSAAEAQPQPQQEAPQQALPHAFRLTSIATGWGLPPSVNDSAVPLSQLLGEQALDGALELQLHSYLLDLDFLVATYPAIGRVPRVLVLYGDGVCMHARCLRAPEHAGRFVLLQPPVPAGTGPVFHPKMIMVRSEARLQLHITSANLTMNSFKCAFPHADRFCALRTV